MARTPSIIPTPSRSLIRTPSIANRSLRASPFAQSSMGSWRPLSVASPGLLPEGASSRLSRTSSLASNAGTTWQPLRRQNSSSSFLSARSNASSSFVTPRSSLNLNSARRNSGATSPLRRQTSLPSVSRRTSFNLNSPRRTSGAASPLRRQNSLSRTNSNLKRMSSWNWALRDRRSIARHGGNSLAHTREDIKRLYQTVEAVFADHNQSLTEQIQAVFMKHAPTLIAQKVVRTNAARTLGNTVRKKALAYFDTFVVPTAAACVLPGQGPARAAASLVVTMVTQIVKNKINNTIEKNWNQAINKVFEKLYPSLNLTGKNLSLYAKAPISVLMTIIKTYKFVGCDVFYLLSWLVRTWVQTYLEAYAHIDWTKLTEVLARHASVVQAFLEGKDISLYKVVGDLVEIVDRKDLAALKKKALASVRSLAWMNRNTMIQVHSERATTFT